MPLPVGLGVGRCSCSGIGARLLLLPPLRSCSFWVHIAAQVAGLSLDLPVELLIQFNCWKILMGSRSRQKWFDRLAHTVELPKMWVSSFH